MQPIAKVAPLIAALALSGLSNARADDLTAALPEDLKPLYIGATSVVLPSAYDNFKAPAAPWKWCHSESYQGNPWRVTVTKELQRLVEGLKDSGIDATFEVSDSNGDTAQQINQVHAFIDKKCTIITSIAGSATALNDVIKSAYDAVMKFVL